MTQLGPRGKLLLRFVDPKDPPQRQVVYETLLKYLKIPLTGLKDQRVGFNAFTEHQHEVDKLLTRESQDILLTIGLTARLPPKIKADRSLICKQIDEMVGRRSADELGKEIRRCNQGMEVEEVIKFGEVTHSFKIQFSTIEQAERAQARGIIAFNMKIASHQIHKEIFTDVLMCFKCYKLDSHTSDKCPTPNIRICSECSGNHLFSECKETQKKCLNCGGPHRTMAWSCRMKKEVAARKRDETKRRETNKTEKTYAQIAERAVEKVTEQAKQIKEGRNILEETGLRALVMVMDAHVHNIIEPGSYSKRLNLILKANNVAPINIPNNPQSDKLFQNNIIGKTLQQMKPKTQEHQQMETEAESEQTEDENILDRHLQKDDIPSIEDVDVDEAKEYGVRLVALDGQVAKEDLNAAAVARYFKHDRIKYIIMNKDVSVEMFETLIKRHAITARKQDIIYLPLTEYRKTRSGFKLTPEKPAKTKKIRPNDSV